MIDLSTRRVIVTGGAGFLGSIVVRKLRERGCSDLFVPRSREYDLTRQDAVERLYREHPADVVIHAAAAVGGIGANQRHPGSFFYRNTVMGAELIEQARLRGIEKFVAIGTICAYPKFTPVPFREDQLWNGYPEETNAPYGIAKKGMLVQLNAYRDEYGFRGIFLLPANLYGPGDNFDPESSHVIPAMIRKLVEAKRESRGEVILWGDGSPTREFLFVDDAAEAIVRATESYESVEPLNFGTGVETTMADLAAKIASIVGYEGRIAWDTSKPNGQPRRSLDVSRAERELGFRATTSLDDGLRKTVEWWVGRRD